MVADIEHPPPFSKSLDPPLISIFYQYLHHLSKLVFIIVKFTLINSNIPKYYNFFIHLSYYMQQKNKCYVIIIVLRCDTFYFFSFSLSSLEKFLIYFFRIFFFFFFFLFFCLLFFSSLLFSNNSFDIALTFCE